MWSWEISGGSTWYLDDDRTFSVATSAFWELHSNKQGELRAGNVTLSDVKVGQLLTLEGGIGKSFLHGAASIGLAYYAQWKVTDDAWRVTSGTSTVAGMPEHHQVWGIGPEVTIPIATKSKLISLVNVRYLWETGAEFKTQGQSLLVTTTFPWGGINIGRR
jgi:hypothetical protein